MPTKRSMRSHPGGPEVGHHIVPIVPACIDQQSKVGALKERRISLPHIDKVDHQPLAAAGSRLRRRPARRLTAPKTEARSARRAWSPSGHVVGRLRSSASTPHVRLIRWRFDPAGPI